MPRMFIAMNLLYGHMSMQQIEITTEPPASLPGSRASEVADHGPNLTKEALQAFASLGSDGFYTGNEERDMTRWLKNLWGFDLQTYQVDINLQVACLSCPILHNAFLYCTPSSKMLNGFYLHGVRLMVATESLDLLL